MTGSSPMSLAIAGSEVAITVESRFSMNRAEATTNGMILSCRILKALVDFDVRRRPLALRKLRIHLFERLAHDLRHRPVSHPVAVGRNDVPRCELGRAALQHGLIRRLVVVPQLSILDIGGVEFPLLVRIGDPFFESFFLLFP